MCRSLSGTSTQICLSTKYTFSLFLKPVLWAPIPSALKLAIPRDPTRRTTASTFTIASAANTMPPRMQRTVSSNHARVTIKTSLEFSQTPKAKYRHTLSLQRASATSRVYPMSLVSRLAPIVCNFRALRFSPEA